MSDENGGERCYLTVAGFGGGAFIALSSSAENLERYLFASGGFWIVSGTVVASCWAFEKFCVKAD